MISVTLGTTMLLQSHRWYHPRYTNGHQSPPAVHDPQLDTLRGSGVPQASIPEFPEYLPHILPVLRVRSPTYAVSCHDVASSAKGDLSAPAVGTRRRLHSLPDVRSSGPAPQNRGYIFSRERSSQGRLPVSFC